MHHLLNKKLFYLNINNYRPDLLKFTKPTFEAYADKIGATIVEIKERVWPDHPITYEKLQISKLGADSDWNILVDADTMIHPDTPDFTLANPFEVMFALGTDVRGLFEPNIYFHRCGHFQGIAANFIVTSKFTHDLWQPSEMSLEELKKQLKRQFIMDEFVLSCNLARYGLRFNGVLNPDILEKYIVHLGSEEKTEQEKKSDTELAEKLSKDWGFI